MANKRSLIYTEAAQSDLEAIFVYIATEGSLNAADRVIDAVTSTCDDLSLFPEMGCRRPELDAFGFEVRSIGEGYVIFYTKLEQSLNVVRVLHSSRDLTLSMFLPLIEVAE